MSLWFISSLLVLTRRVSFLTANEHRSRICFFFHSPWALIIGVGVFLIIPLWENTFPCSHGFHFVTVLPLMMAAFYLGELFPGLRRRACSLTDMANWDTGRMEPSLTLTGHTCASPAPASRDVWCEKGLLDPARDLMLRLKANSVWCPQVHCRTGQSTYRHMKTQIRRPFTYTVSPFFARPDTNTDTDFLNIFTLEGQAIHACTNVEYFVFLQMDGAMRYAQN